jgi:hypothetical protein
MTDITPTYTFEGDEVFAIHEGKIIASGNDMGTVESEATAYLEGLNSIREEAKRKKATHIITPNGIKGEIMGRTPSVWGEQITARFENGQMTTFQVHASSDVEWVTDHVKVASTSPVEKLASRLSADYEHSTKALANRFNELGEISKQAHGLINSGAPYTVEVELDQIRTAADHERKQVKEALDHLESVDAENFIPSAPFEPMAVSQADLGHSNNWLDITTQEMIDEAEGVDYDKLLDEGPAVFATELDNGALADAGVTREMALSHIVAKTAAFAGEEIEEYRNTFIARVEVARRHELGSRKANNHKEAAAAQEVCEGATDESLFM